MLKTFSILAILFILPGLGRAIAQKIYQTTNGQVEFFSSAPVEDISAVSNKGVSVLSTSGEISFRVQIKSLNFPKSLMQEHFNENYMESDKFPAATFKGRIINTPDLSITGEFQVILQGVLEVHGVKQSREIPASLTVVNGIINLKSQFDVACEDHNIKIPRILWQNIAEVVQVKINANFK